VETEHPFKAFRTERGLTQAEAAAQAGVHQTDISRGETRGFSYATAAKVALAFGLPLSFLLPPRRRRRRPTS